MRKFYRIPMVVGILLLALNSFSQNGKTIADLVKKDAKKLHLSSADADNLLITNLKLRYSAFLGGMIPNSASISF